MRKLLQRGCARLVRMTAVTIGAVAAAVTIAPTNASAVTSADVARSEQVTAQLHADVIRAKPGDTITIVLQQTMEEGWHTYWRNAGDGGFPTEITWTLPDGVTAGDIAWPAPKRFTLEPFQNYGFEDEALLLVEVSVPANWRLGRPIVLEANANWLACKDICVPEQATFQLHIPTAPIRVRDQAIEEMALRARALHPTPLDVEAGFVVGEDGFALTVASSELAAPDLEDIYFFPVAENVLHHSGPQKVTRGADGLRIDADPGNGLGEIPQRLQGVITAVDTSGDAPSRLAVEITADRDHVADIGPVVASGSAADGSGAYGGGASLGGSDSSSIGALGGFGSGGASLFLLLLFAFVGGLILNVMPCVFPILALKALKIAKQADASRQTRVSNGLAYGAGVLASFVALGGALLVLRAGGEAVGWGFQLQSPLVVAVLAYLMVLVGLNLSGVFEIGGGMMGLGSSYADRAGVPGSFFTGVLAAVIGAPCVGPFLGAALGAAATLDGLTAMVVFVAMGLGFAAPMVALALLPGAARLLPKPGPWMLRFRQLMAFPMYLAAALLIWVLAQQTSIDNVLGVMIGLVLVAFAAWMLGSGLPTARASRIVAFVAAVAAIIGAGAALPPSAATASAASRPSAVAFSEPYSPERLEALAAEGRGVFVNMTAAWCVTCKWNERFVLAGDAFRTTLETADVVYMEGDWTSPDPEITAFLSRFGRAGVPLYVFFPPDGGEPTVLPELLSDDLVREVVGAG